MAPHKQPKKTAAPVSTPLKRAAAQMSRSPKLELPVTPSPFSAASVTSTSRPCTVRPYQSPLVEDAPKEDEVAPEFKGALIALQLKADAYLNCCANDKDAGLAGDSKDTPLKGKEPRTPKSKDKKATTPVTRGGLVVCNLNDLRQALLHHAKTLAELD
ncbi:hypothetical protein VF21_10426 [Pseudogymnoascus sp. 05NY08]|nr:hypothetical protein VF21_10426 [Pseudogymnoascus sp. 05NY08]